MAIIERDPNVDEDAFPSILLDPLRAQDRMYRVQSSDSDMLVTSLWGHAHETYTVASKDCSFQSYGYMADKCYIQLWLDD